MKRGETQTITTPTVQALNQMPGCRAFRMNAGKWKVRNGWVHGAEEGTADVIGWIWGRFFAIETKTPEGDLKPKQIEFLAKVNADGGIGFCARSPAEAVQRLMGWPN